MDMYKTMNDFNESVGLEPLMKSVVTAIPIFFDVLFFLLFLGFTASSYFLILKTTGKKRIWHSLTSMSFVFFLASLGMVVMNTATITYLNSYWIFFYIVTTLVSWYMLTHYKE